MNIKELSRVSFFLIAMCFSLISNAENSEKVWIDVRSYVENTIDSIDGDIRISHDEILQEVGEIYPDKNTEIRLYCRSGGRAAIAMSALKDAGYTNVSNAGGIDDARKERGIIE